MANYLLNFLSDPAERDKVRQGFMDAVNRGAIATALGAPVDMLNLGANALRAGYGYAGHKLGLISADQMPELVDKPVGGSEWIGDQMQRIGSVSPTRNALAEGLAGLLTINPQKSAKMVAGVVTPAMDAVDAGASGLGKAAIVWQGSPHIYDAEKLVRLPSGVQAYVGGKFNTIKEVPPGATVLQDFPLGRIRSEAIGTGEGAQAYGHGSYLAESQQVGKSYADELGDLELLHNGQRVGVFDKDPAANAAHQIRATGGDIEKAIKRAQALYTGNWKDSVVNEIKRLGPGDVSERSAGSLYKVDLPDNMIARMLDWDKPFSQQAPEVRKALQDAEVVGRDDWLISGMRGRETYNRAKFGAPVKLPLNQADDQIYAAERLRQAGIPGIRYLDQGSRNISQQVKTAMDGLAYWNKMGDPAKIAQAERVLANAKKMNGFGTSNFVVFPGEENALTILERNGRSLLD